MSEFIEQIASVVTAVITPINDVVWGPIMLVLLLGTGLFLTFGLRFLTWRDIPRGFKLMWRGRAKLDHLEGELSPFNALMTALAATVGTGNIVGVATAILIGGPGALFWMWCTAMVGMATKFAETVLAVQYREVTPAGNVVGGPMYFIKNGLGKNWLWLGTLFAIFGGLAGFGIGNLTQTNAISGVLAKFGISPWITAGVLFVLLGIVVVGGVQRIGAVSGKLVPFMALFYILTALIIIVVHIDRVPEIFMLVIREAFSPSAAQGGFAGATVWLAIRYGVARGVFSNEAGLGSAAIAQATATVDNPVTMGLIGMLGTFIDTIIVCSMTGFAILVTGVWTAPGANGATLTSVAFASGLPPFLQGWGDILVTIALALFAFSTILGWCVYSERCWVFLLGDKALKPFRLIFTIVAPIGAVSQLDTAWLVADTLNALMAIPNLVGLLLLSPVLFKLVNDYNSSPKKDELL
ncbi:MAG: sodium:alanine symporter family protein [Desulfovibrionaceae bacterium]|nr:sodium:alanine symporter family protein [Desulfovibrionaceae bacterium]